MRAPQRTRQGWSLIEIVAAITVGSVIFGLALVLAHGFLRMDTSLRMERQTWASLARLAEQFRDDAHAAHAVAAPAPNPAGAKPVDSRAEYPGATWTLRLADDHRAEYTVAGEEVTRIEHAGGKVVSRERYVLPPGTIAKLEPPAAGSRRVALRIVPQEIAGRQPAAQALRIEALVGFDYRFASKGAQP